MPFNFWPFARRQHERLTWELSPPQIYTDGEGRRHRADAPYLLPKDEQEIHRLDYQHYIFRHILGGDTFAPIDDLLRKGGNVLDVGCGTGRWGYEIATKYKHTRVYGVDLEEMARPASTPLNYQFQRENILDGLSFAGQQFHYVHQRALVAGIPVDKWPFVVGELKRVTLPGGWVELVELGITFYNAGPATKQFLQWWSAISATRHIDATLVTNIGSQLQKTGFSHIQKRTETVPVGNWGGRIGNLLAQDIIAVWPTIKPYAHELLHVQNEDFDAVIAQLVAEWNSLHTLYEVYFACGQA